MMKHQPINKLPKSFIQFICKKYDNKITVNQYIIERLIYRKIFNVFSHIKLIDSSFMNSVTYYNSNNKSDLDNLNIVLNKYPSHSLYQAISYSKTTNNIGIIFDNYETDFSQFIAPLNMSKNALLSIRFCNFRHTLKDKPLSHFYHFRENLTLSNTYKFGDLFEYVITLCELSPKNPVHLDIKQTILDKLINPYEITTSDNTV